MGPIYAMGGQPGATTCINGCCVGQPARRATHRTVHAPPAWPAHFAAGCQSLPNPLE